MNWIEKKKEKNLWFKVYFVIICKKDKSFIELLCFFNWLKKEGKKKKKRNSYLCSLEAMSSTAYGISEPISTGGPSELDVVRNRELEKVCSWFTLYFLIGKVFFCRLCLWWVLQIMYEHYDLTNQGVSPAFEFTVESILPNSEVGNWNLMCDRLCFLNGFVS